MIAIIGGSGLDERLAVDGLLDAPQHVELTTPFGAPSAPITVGTLARSDVRVAVLKRHGVGHTHPPHRVPWRANLFALKSLGVTHIIATGAVGSLREEIKPGDLVLCDQLIDRTSGAGNRSAERTFFDHAAVHVEFADPCCPIMRKWLLGAAACFSEELRVHETGTYVVIDGPTFSTRAESHLHRAMGCDVVGMTALPEARLAREAEIAYALIALPTDYDSWRTSTSAPGQAPESLLKEIIANLERSADGAAKLIEAALADVSILREHPSPAHDALKLGIWTRKDLISKADIDRLRPIWGRYFSA